jgi:hypothetical protein
MELLESGLRDSHNHKSSKYRCECGVEFITRDYSVRIGKSTHCGCKNIKHGLCKKDSGRKPSVLFNNIKKRCYDKKGKSYKDYGGRGILMQENWVNDLEKFHNYVVSLENAYKDGYSIDRIDNNSGYVEGNLKWSTRKEQNNNRRDRITKTGYDKITVDRHMFKIKVPLGDSKYKCYWTKTIEDAIELRDRLFS